MPAFWEEAPIIDAPATAAGSFTSGADPAAMAGSSPGWAFWEEAPIIAPAAQGASPATLAGPNSRPADVAPPNVTTGDVASPIDTALVSEGRALVDQLITSGGQPQRSAAGALSAEDQRQFSALERVYGRDPARFAQALTESGNPRLAALARGADMTSGAPAGPDGQPQPAGRYAEMLDRARSTEPGQEGAPAGALVNAMRGLPPEEAAAARRRAQGMEEPAEGAPQMQAQPEAARHALADPILRTDGKPYETASSATLAARQRPDLKGRALEPVRLEGGGWGLREQEGAPRQGDGIGPNIAAGATEAFASMAGALPELFNDRVNDGVRLMNSLFGTNQRTVEKPAGGSGSIQDAAGVAGIDPRDVEAVTPGERVARSAGAGVVGTVFPGAAARAAVGAGVGAGHAIAGPVLEAMAAPSVAANVAMGAAAGAGGQLAEDALPADAGPGARALTRFAGEMVGGAVPAVAGPVMAAGGRAVAEGARRTVEPFTAAGRERMAGRTLYEAATDPKGAIVRLDTAEEIIPGSAPTTAQASGDTGLLALERGVSRRDPAPFLERQAGQETARSAAVESAAPTGRPEAVTEFITRDVARIEEAADARFAETLARFDAGAQARRDAFGAGAQARRDGIAGRMTAAVERRDASAEAMGGTRPAPEIGAELRAELETIKRDEKAALNRLYAEVDPGNTLVIDIAGMKSAAAQITRALPKAAALTPTESRLHAALADMPKAERFSEIMALRSELTGAIREERALRGETPALRRMQQFRSAIEEAIGSGQQPARADRAPAAALPPPEGTDRVFTPTGRAVDVEYTVVEADTLRPGAGQFQPRDRSRTASDLQIQSIAGNLQPERLAQSPELGTGAPLTTRDGMVLDGNGRTAAVLRAYEMNGTQARQYRAMVEREFPDAAGMRAPVMVRRPAGDLPDDDLAAIAREANTGRGAAYSPAQQARIDADRFTDDVLGAYRGGAIDAPENADFVRAFARTLAPEEYDSFITRANTLSEPGRRRLQAAAVERAYGGGLTERLFETGDEEIRALGRGLADAAPAVAQLRAAIARGEVPADMDLAQAVQDAVTVATRARRAGVPIGDVLAQADAFNPVHPLTPELLTAFYGPNLSRISSTRTTEALTTFAREAMQAGAEGQMFGGASAAEIARGAVRRTAGIDPDAPTPAALAGGGGVVRQELEPNFDATAAARYRGASSAYREFAARFKDGPTDRVLRAAKGGEGYQVPDGEVAARFFNAGKRAKEDVEAFARTVGNRERAAELLTEYAAASLRSAAMKADGTLDKQAHFKWLNRHADALRALDGLSGGKEARARFLQVGEAQRLVNDLEAEAAGLEKALAAGEKTLARDIEAGRAATTRAATAERKATVAEAQAGAAARFLNGADPVRAVGSALSSVNASDAMGALVRRMKGDAEAIAGLRRAVVEHMNQTLRGTAEVGDTGATAWQPGRYFAFMRKNEAALAEVFEPNELKTLQSVAADLFRANRSAAGSRLPGGSDTAQNSAAIRRLPSKVSMLGRIVAGAGGAGSGAAVGGPAGALAGAVVTDLYLYGRSVGIEKVNDIITAAMLDPQLAARLLRRVSPKTENMLARDVIKRLEALGIASTPTLVPEVVRDVLGPDRGDRAKESTSARAPVTSRTPTTPPAGQDRPAAGRGAQRLEEAPRRGPDSGGIGRSGLLSGGMRDGTQAGQPAGSGTKADPYRGTSPAEVDWFAANAPAGAVIQIDGKLYRK